MVLRDCARNAGGALGRLYGGVAGAYQYPSAMRQIDNSGHRPDIDQVRASLANPPMPALHPPANPAGCTFP